MAAFGGEHGACGWASHSVTHAHDVDARNATPNVEMHAFEVVENGFLPVVPISAQKKLAVLGWGAVG